MSSVALSAASLAPVFLARGWGRRREGAPVLVSGVASQKCRIRGAMVEPDDPNKLRFAPGVLKETVLNVVPEPVRQLPWEKAERVLINKAIFIGQKALKWVLIALLVTCSLSDFLFAITRSRELLAPIGLYAGCLLTDFLKEVAVDYSGDTWDAYLPKFLIAVGCFFTILKFASGRCALGARIFLLHVANGGFMQIFWLWRTMTSQTEADCNAGKQLLYLCTQLKISSRDKGEAQLYKQVVPDHHVA
ncbi:hypothetical protein MLD38_022378 [Melastoma candidum]|uniref:Uncharacterized protein n=1 Tax=Melastoma candidum TaxID=119954 RepID=A0ACB9QKV5_9MYRT|nr:hypothetical protein MLD38_022378 [Melastoma candidum]